MQASRQVLLLPRGLIFFSAIWLIVSWFVTIGVQTPVYPTSASFTPGVRLMLISMTIGLMIGWPLLRLSQAATAYPIRQTLLDLLVLLSLVQVVAWPLRLVTTWSPLRTAAIDATICGWLLIVAGIVAAAIGSRHSGARMLAMLGCVGVCLLAPAAIWTGVVPADLADRFVDLSPLTAVHHLGLGGAEHPTVTQWQWLGWLGAGAVLVWIAAGLAVSITLETENKSAAE